MPTRRMKAAGVVLVVDDHEDTRDLYADTLRDAGYVVETAANGSEAIEKAATSSPSVVLTDLAMPGSDGWEAIKALKSDPARRRVWIVAVTARSERHDLDRAYAAGCDAVVLKPALPDEILRAVATGLARLRAGAG